MKRTDMIEENKRLRRENDFLRHYCIQVEQTADFWRTEYLGLAREKEPQEGICDFMILSSIGR